MEIKVVYKSNSGWIIDYSNDRYQSPLALYHIITDELDRIKNQSWHRVYVEPAPYASLSGNIINTIT
jgi:hypothetical protein